MELLLRLLFYQSWQDPLRHCLEHFAHALVVGRDDNQQVDIGKHEDELSAGTASGFAVVSFAIDLDIVSPPEKSVAGSLRVSVNF